MLGGSVVSFILCIFHPWLPPAPNNTDHKGEHDAHHPAGLHIVLPSHDGHLYIVDGRRACIDRVDLGENSYSMVLADDLSGNGYMDLVVTTMNGNVYLLNTGRGPAGLGAARASFFCLALVLLVCIVCLWGSKV